MTDSLFLYRIYCNCQEWHWHGNTVSYLGYSTAVGVSLILTIL
jgi:hypothetical protein